MTISCFVISLYHEQLKTYEKREDVPIKCALRFSRHILNTSAAASGGTFREREYGDGKNGKQIGKDGKTRYEKIGGKKIGRCKNLGKKTDGEENDKTDGKGCTEKTFRKENGNKNRGGKKKR